ncbi:NUDIX hydrolase [Streptomyces carpaticus]|uniref:NUDIX domain-containing protein n=1 Tax=Streptomyces carpaticus TaxID=285558 RepID=UPI0022100162|nr:NUDIX hydrolase [Streptomyces carpaticus]
MRIEGLALFQREEDVLLLDRGPRAGAERRFDLPGAVALPGELAPAASRRGVREALGLEITPGGLLGVHATSTGETTHHTFIFDGGPLQRTFDLVLGDGVLGCLWVHRDNLRALVAAQVEWRINVAADAGAPDAGPTRYLTS